MKAFLCIATASATRSAGYKALEDFISSLKIAKSVEPEALPGSWCVEDYSGACPDGWNSTEGGCRSSGATQCPGTYSFSSATTAEKVNFANECQTPWPCASTCAKNYSSCPIGWVDTGNGTCSGPAGAYEGCSDIYDFSSLSVGEKRQLVLACELQWECLDSTPGYGHEETNKTRMQSGF